MNTPTPPVPQSRCRTLPSPQNGPCAPSRSAPLASSLGNHESDPHHYGFGVPLPEPHVDGIVQYVSFRVWPLRLHILVSNIKIFKHSDKSKEFYSKFLYTHNLDSAINILLYLLYFMSIHLLIPLFIHHSTLFLMHFKVNLRRQSTSPLKTSEYITN